MSRLERYNKPNVCSDGYFRICFYKDELRNYSYIHRLVVPESIEKIVNGNIVDHANFNETTNTVNNLRWAPKAEHAMNQNKRQTRATPKYKGVSFDKQLNEWRARIRLSWENNSLGCFTDEKAVANKYKEATEDLFGEFALLSEVSSDEADDEDEDEDEDEAQAEVPHE